MYGLAEKIFYSLIALVLGSVLFVVQHSSNRDVVVFQNNVKDEFKLAAVQVLGDEPVFENFELVISSVTQFYQKSADQMIALLAPTPSEEAARYVFGEVFNSLRLALDPKLYTSSNVAFAPTVEPQVLGVETEPAESAAAPVGNFMQEPALENIVPEEALEPVLGAEPAQIMSVAPQNQTWANLTDGTTGQVYCVAIFNAEVNRYLGPCKNDYY